MIREDTYIEILSQLGNVLKEEFSKVNLLDVSKLSTLLELDINLCRDLVDSFFSAELYDDTLSLLQLSDYDFIYNNTSMTMFTRNNTMITETEVQTFFPESKDEDLSERVIHMLENQSLIEKIDDGLWRSVVASGDDIVRETIILD